MKVSIRCILVLVYTVNMLSCKKGDNNGGSHASTTPTVKTTDASSITITTAVSGGVISSDGGSTVTARGVCWSELSSSPTIADTKTTDGSGSGMFTSTLESLKPYHAYTVRAYATNSSGTSYGNSFVILTLPGASLHTTNVEVSNYTRSCETTASIDGFDDQNFKPITQSGICWSSRQNPTTADTVSLNGPITKAFIDFMTQLRFSINTTYYIRAFATSSGGTVYGNQIMYTTGVELGLTNGGGFVCYVDNTGQHGLIAAISDQGTNVLWAPAGLANVATNASSSTNGASNTTSIINSYGNSGVYAAKLCRDYRGGGFSDWYLPSNVEINEMNLNEGWVPNFPPPVEFTPFYYWSSTEYDYFRAWEYDFNPLYYEHPYEVKDKGRSVRAVRSF